MEKDKFFVNVSNSPLQPNWHSQSSGTDIRLRNMNCVPEQLQSGFLNLNWENSLDHSAPFEPALNSIISSPATVATSYSTTSCYNTPLDSPSKLNLSTIPGNSMTAPTSLVPFSADPGFAERAAKFSCFGGGNYGGPAGQLGFNDTELLHRSVLKMGSGKLSRVSSIQSLRTGSEVGVLDNKETGLPDGLEAEMRSISPSSLDRKFSRLSRSSTPDDAEFANAHDESSPSNGIAGGDVSLNGPIDINVRKRKAFTRGKPKEFLSSPSAKDPKVAEENDSNAKRSKSTEANVAGKDSAEQNGIPNAVDCGQKQTKDNTKPPEPPKQDYIHVRARRGQATDSHSLAERVRREKISERMKFLQDLVPGCNKVTGKAVMLDEIINYVQSLQRQVEFLSMKLANVNPRLDLNMETLLSKNILQSHGPAPNSMFPLDSSAPAFLYGQQPQHGPVLSIASNGSEAHGSVIPLDLHRNLGAQLAAIDGCGDASSQLANFWEDDLQSVVQMGFGQNQETAFPFHGSLPTTHMKVEL